MTPEDARRRAIALCAREWASGGTHHVGAPVSDNGTCWHCEDIARELVAAYDAGRYYGENRRRPGDRDHGGIF